MFRRVCSFILMFHILAPGKSCNIESKTLSKLRDCVAKTKHFVVPDKFNGIITAQKFLANGKSDLR